MRAQDYNVNRFYEFMETEFSEYSKDKVVRKSSGIDTLRMYSELFFDKTLQGFADNEETERYGPFFAIRKWIMTHKDEFNEYLAWKDL